MSAATVAKASARRTRVPPLRDGERLTRAEFLRRWDAMPDLKRAERVEGVVRLMPSPVSVAGHARPHGRIATLIGLFEIATPGVMAYSDGTTHVDGDNDYQPDVALAILPEFGGQLAWSGEYVDGAPDLVVEVSKASARRDRTVKRNVYRRNGVKEYLIWQPSKREFQAFRNVAGEFLPHVPAKGVWRSEAFPGLRLNIAALAAGGGAAALATVQAGIASPEHAAFVAELSQRRKR